MAFITKLEPNQIFVFGSNVDGLHYGGAAKQAMEFGAEFGNPVGRQGQTYAIPTIDLKNGEFLGWDKIMEYMQDFRDYASKNPDLEFLLTPIGTGIAGGSIKDLDTIVNSMSFPDNVVKIW